MKWIIQENLLNENDLNQLGNACDKARVDHEGVTVVPFSPDLPAFTHDKNNVYYGSTTFMNNVYEDLEPKGLFYDPFTFNMQAYVKHWGESVLNHGGTLTTIGELVEATEYTDDQFIFIRPNADSKTFAGEVIQFKELSKWFKQLQGVGSEILDDLIWVNRAFNIHYEWRNLVVNGKVVTSSLYRTDFRLTPDALKVPQSMIDFVEEQCKIWTPHDVFVMDIASGDIGDYYIIEAGCANSAGFYKMDVNKFVKSITEYMVS